MIGKKAILVLPSGDELKATVLELDDDGDTAKLGSGNSVYGPVSRDDEGGPMSWRPAE